MISYKENFMLDYSCENYKNEEALYIEKMKLYFFFERGCITFYIHCVMTSYYFVEKCSFTKNFEKDNTSSKS